jgi:hypothetical protein
MPAKVQKRGDKYRVVEPSGKLVRRNGTPVDGGGHESEAKAKRQAAAVNSK